MTPQRCYSHPKLVAGPGEDRGHPFGPPRWLVLLARVGCTAFAAIMAVAWWHHPVSPAPLFLLIALIALHGTFARD